MAQTILAQARFKWDASRVSVLDNFGPSLVQMGRVPFERSLNLPLSDVHVGIVGWASEKGAEEYFKVRAGGKSVN